VNDKLYVSPAASSPTSVKVVEPTTLRERLNHLHHSIAQRAYAMFEDDGGKTGRDLDHWLIAEQELLHPVHVNITDSDGKLTVRAEVPGFSAGDLQLSLEPSRLTIAGRKTTSHNGHDKDGFVYRERCASEILRVLDLPEEVDASKAAAALKDGVLELVIPKVSAVKNNRAAAQTA
jgi:HSP20 family molecular chaperone IbpA